MRNFLASLLLGFAAQQVAWTALDYQGLQQYGEEGWPYELNPFFGGIIAVIALGSGIAALKRRLSFSGPAAIILALSAGIHFWLSRKPANPYTDYGEDNFIRMFLNLIFIGTIMMLICSIEFFLRRKSPLTPRPSSTG
ncbi:hypothetical protein N9057_05825 [Akkermansiaceae bacterium]|jgi:hypothetical protein|nr:hypothetical protein [Akkermansiaceae bacterium]